jgi:hypothetical protein
VLGRVRKEVRTLRESLHLKLAFLRSTRRVLHLKNPRTYSEKIQWLKLNGSLERYASYADKYEVRRYVAGTIGPQYLVPLIGVWDEFDQIPLDALPEQFVLKATHGFRYNYICRDKSSLDVASLRQSATSWLAQNFYSAGHEPQYRDIRPRLVVEEYLEDYSGELVDYKFICFDGRPQVLEVMGNRRREVTVDVYDREWNWLPIRVSGYPSSPRPFMKPALLDEMYDVAARLAAGFPFVRVDLYFARGQVYFGELTFTPYNGLAPYKPRAFELEMGRMLDLSKLA